MQYFKTSRKKLKRNRTSRVIAFDKAIKYHFLTDQKINCIMIGCHENHYSHISSMCIVIPLFLSVSSNHSCMKTRQNKK